MPNGIWRIKDGKSTLGARRREARRHPERHGALARRAIALRDGASKMMRYEVKPDGSLGAGVVVRRGARHRRRHEEWTRAATSTRRAARDRASSGSRRRAASCSGLLESADLRRRAEAADLRDERCVRRRRRQEPVRDGLRRVYRIRMKVARRHAGAAGQSVLKGTDRRRGGGVRGPASGPSGAADRRSRAQRARLCRPAPEPRADANPRTLAVGLSTMIPHKNYGFRDWMYPPRSRNLTS